MKNLLTLITILLLTSTFISAQSVVLEKKVTIQYFDIKLEDALDDISKSYDVNFSYSKNVIPIHQKVSADVDNAPLSIALEDLLDETDVAYVGIGDQIVLKKDPNKRKLLSKGKKKKKVVAPPIPRRKKISQPVLLSSTKPRALDTPQRDISMKYQLVKIKIEKVEEIDNDWGETELDRLSTKVDVLAEKLLRKMGKKAKEVEEEIKVQTKQLGSIKLIGGNSNKVNNVSANIIWGKNGGLNGIEVGVLGNTIVKDMNGVQVGGIGNVVGGKVRGVQASTTFNVNRGTTSGVQATGIINISGNLKNGIQAAGIGNVAGKNSKRGAQFSGIFNVSGGDMWTQASLINASKKARLQIGLINAADSAGATIGLLNFVRNGYNRIEVSTSELLHYNAELKLGSKGFYNIFHLGWRPLNSNEGHLAYGYGFGTRFAKRRRRFSQNLELVASRINESSNNIINVSGENHLNVLGQFRWTWDWRLGRKWSFFAGPTFNTLLSRSVNPDTGEVGLDLVPYKTFYNKTFTNSSNNTNSNGVNVIQEVKTNIKMWAGFKAGFRF